MKSRIISILLFNLIILSVSAGSRKLNFQVYDELTQLGIRPFVEVYNATDTSKIINSFSSLKIGEFSLNIDENLPKIIIKIYGTREEVKNNEIWHFKSDYYTPECIGSHNDNTKRILRCKTKHLGMGMERPIVKINYEWLNDVCCGCL